MNTSFDLVISFRTPQGNLGFMILGQKIQGSISSFNKSFRIWKKFWLLKFYLHSQYNELKRSNKIWFLNNKNISHNLRRGLIHSVFMWEGRKLIEMGCILSTRLQGCPQNAQKVSQTDSDTSPVSPSALLTLTQAFTGTACITTEHIPSMNFFPIRINYGY